MFAYSTFSFITALQDGRSYAPERVLLMTYDLGSSPGPWITSSSLFFRMFSTTFPDRSILNVKNVPLVPKRPCQTSILYVNCTSDYKAHSRQGRFIVPFRLSGKEPLVWA